MSDRCAECRDALLARDAGELSVLHQERIDAHLRGCRDCRALRTELSSLVAAGRAWAPAPTPEERDALYEAVARTPPATARRPRTSGRRWIAGALAMAAAIAAAVLGLATLAGPGPTDRAHTASARAPALRARPAAPVPAPPPPIAAREPTTPALHESTPTPGLTVRAEADAEWRYDPAAHHVALGRGAIWIAYAHGARREALSAEGPGVRVTVTGTVLFLRATPNGTDVGVLSGHVLVQPAGGGATPVAEGKVRLASGTVRGVQLDEAQPAGSWTDDGHERPAATRAATPARPAGDEPRSAAPGPASAEMMYGRAEAALAAGDPGRAADELRQLVQTWPLSGQAGTARLELARLYAGPLHRPELAIAQLRRFLTTARSSSAATAARAELCRLLPPDEREVEPGCRSAP